MRFGIFALIVSLGASASLLSVVPGSTAHWIASGAGTAVLVYLRHRVRRRGLQGLWRWGTSAELDEAFRFLERERGESFWSQFRSRRQYKSRRAPRNAGNDQRASGTPVEEYTSCKTFVVVWYQREDGQAIRRVRLETGSGGVPSLGGRDIFTLNDVEMERLRRHLAENDPRGMQLLERIVQTSLRHPWSELQLNWARRQADLGRGETRQKQGRESAGNRSQKSGESNAVREARELLGVEEGATEKTIRERWRVMMNWAHPDKGGSAPLFRMVRKAGELLLSEKSRGGPSASQ